MGRRSPDEPDAGFPFPKPDNFLGIGNAYELRNYGHESKSLS